MTICGWGDGHSAVYKFYVGTQFNELFSDGESHFPAAVVADVAHGVNGFLCASC